MGPTARCLQELSSPSPVCRVVEFLVYPHSCYGQWLTLFGAFFLGVLAAALWRVLSRISAKPGRPTASALSPALPLASPVPPREPGPSVFQEPPPKQPPRELIVRASREDEVTAWLELLVGDHRGARSLHEWLHSGEILCHAVNIIQPGMVQVYASNYPMKQVQNAAVFLDACRELGLPEDVLFPQESLLEGQHMRKVVRCVHQLGAHAHLVVPDFPGPILEDRWNSGPTLRLSAMEPPHWRHSDKDSFYRAKHR